MFVCIWLRWLENYILYRDDKKKLKSPRMGLEFQGKVQTDITLK